MVNCDDLGVGTYLLGNGWLGNGRLLRVTRVDNVRELNFNLDLVGVIEIDLDLFLHNFDEIQGVRLAIINIVILFIALHFASK